MFKEVESHFANLPSANVRRSKFRRPHTVKTTANFGYLAPFYVDEILPGDTFKISYSALARMSTAIHPTMDNAYLDVYFFYVPSRILWDDYENFEGANDDPWTQDLSYFIPQYGISDEISSQSLMDYFGFSPVRIATAVSALEEDYQVNALPIRAYVKIWNSFFRDENLQSAETELKNSGTSDHSYYSIFDPDAECLPVAKYHDYFTSALPQPQKHGDVLLPLGQQAPVKLDDKFKIGSTIVPTTFEGDMVDEARKILGYNGFNMIADSDSDTPIVVKNGSAFLGDSGAFWQGQGNGKAAYVGIEGDATQYGTVYDPGKTLYADLSSATAATVNQLRLAIQTQRLFERDARGGTRYVEILRSHFGVSAPDARLQRPEYLGGKRIPLNMDQILQTSETNTTPLGNTAGWSLTSAVDKGIVKSFVERGYILGLFCLRTDQSYSQGIEKLWSRKSRLDFYFPVLAHLGEMPILNKEIYVQGTSKDNEAFGYQEAWADYRYKPSQITGKFRPDVSGSLSSWTYTQKYDELPTLGSRWLKQGKREVDNTLVVTSTNAPQVMLDFYLDLECVRPMPTYSIPGLMDHF